MNSTYEMIKKHKFIAILRNIPEDKLENTAKALYNGGARLFEITFNPSDPDTIKKTAMAFEIIKNACGNGISVGAGTVVKKEYVAEAKKMGAEFIVAPNTDQEVISLTKENGMLSIPGAFTPSEIVTAHKLGADIVKIFPIEPHNISYLKNILSPVSHIPFITTGGVNEDTADELMKTGAAALAAGASVIPVSALNANDFSLIEEKTRKLISIIKNA